MKSRETLIVLVIACLCLVIGKSYVDARLEKTKQALIMILDAALGVQIEQE